MLRVSLFSYRFNEYNYCFQDSISELNLPENKSLKDHGRLLYDGEMRIKAHDDQKIRFR